MPDNASAVTAVPAVRPDRPWLRAWITALATTAIAHVAYLLINACYWMVRATAPPAPEDFFSVWDRWDTGHYEAIAGHGYDPTTGSGAFFPLYPMLMAAVDPVLPGGLLTAARFVATVACVAALACLYRLAEDLAEEHAERTGERIVTGMGNRTAMFLMASPFGFYLVAGYNESLFLALSVASLYFMRRANWWLAGAFAGLASGTRYFGIVLGLAFVVEYLRQRDWDLRRTRWDALAIALVPTGLIAFMIYSAYAFDDPLRFAHLQQTNWYHEFHLPWVGIIGSIEQTFDWWDKAPFDTWAILNLFDLLAVPVILLLLVLAVVGPWRLGQPGWYLVAFGAVNFLGVLMSPTNVGLPPLHGLPRYALELVPIYLVLARIGRRRAVERAYLFPAIALQSSLLMAYFTHIFLS